MSYYGLLTPVGAAKEANAKALGIPILLTHMAVCHGNGADLTPPQLINGLIGEWRRAPLNQLSIDPQNPAYLVAEQIIPENVGGQYIRGLGLYDSDGDLFYVANCPPTYKPQLSEGSARTQVIRMVMAVGSPANFELRIDPSVVLAPRSYVDAGLARKLDKEGTAVAAVKLETARLIGISGGVTGAAQLFDGRANLNIQVTAIDVSKANAGSLAVAHGGTGVSAVDAGRFLVGGGAGQPLQTLTPSAALASMSGVPVVSITALPASNVGPVLIAETGEAWIWTQTAFFTGYRSPLCGRPVDGHTINPLASEIDAVGGLVSKSAYAGLWAYARENNLVLTQAQWTASLGAHGFVDVNATQFRVPDLRNMFRRFAGTDSDTGTARAAGTLQADDIKSHNHNIDNGGSRIWGGTGSADSASSAGNRSYLYRPTNNTGGTETRPVNVAFHPRIHA